MRMLLSSTATLFLLPKNQLPPRRMGYSSSSAVHQRNITIVGGGLAGLSTVFHLLTQAQTPLDITVLDCQIGPGRGGASAVAGGYVRMCTAHLLLSHTHKLNSLLHPLSPRGKLVYRGMEGLLSTHRLVQKAQQYNDTVVIRSELYRLADNHRLAALLSQNALDANRAEWLEPSGLVERGVIQSSSSSTIAGGLRMFKECQVLHVPSYLQGLWKGCCAVAAERGSRLRWEQKAVAPSNPSTAVVRDVNNNNTIIWCAGSGLFPLEYADDETTTSTTASPLFSSLPIQLVRGQSVELVQQQEHAALCGKYIIPTLQADVCLVGATHEHKVTTPMTPKEVAEELQTRMAPVLSSTAVFSSIHRVTTGVRVQSLRGNQGRLPIVGRWGTKDWIFTGLSSRGLLYHGWYGEILAAAVLANNETLLVDQEEHALWWKK